MGLFSKPEVIILKDSNDAKTYLDKLKTLQPSAFGDLQDQIQKEIAIFCHIEPASLTAILNGMENKGYIERRTAGSNRRSLHVYPIRHGSE